MLKSLFSSPEPEGVSLRLLNLIRDGGIWKALLADPFSYFVDFEEPTAKHMCYGPEYVYEAELIPSIPKGVHIVVLFLHQPDKLKILDSAKCKDLEELNREINKRKSGRSYDEKEKAWRFTHEIQLAICWKDCIYKVRGALGNIYIQWSRELSIYQEGSLEIDKSHGDVGFITHTNGYHKALAVYPLLDLLRVGIPVKFINPGSFRFPYATGMALYTCDTRAPKSAKAQIVPLSQEDVRVRRELRVVPEHEKIDFEHHRALRKVVEPKRGDGNGYSDYSESEVTSGVSIDWEPNPAPGPGQGEDGEMDDMALAFFSGGVEGEQEASIGATTASMFHLKLSSMIVPPVVVSSSDGEGILLEPVSVTDRRRVPRSLVPRSDHRTSVSRIRHTPQPTVQHKDQDEDVEELEL